MYPQHFMRIPATVFHREVSGREEDYGNEETTETEIPTLCWIEQASTTETDNAQLTEADWVVWLPPEIPVVATDRVKASGVVMEVIGVPDKPIHPRTGDVLLTRVVGKEVT